MLIDVRAIPVPRLTMLLLYIISAFFFSRAALAQADLLTLLSEIPSCTVKHPSRCMVTGTLLTWSGKMCGVRNNARGMSIE